MTELERFLTAKARDGESRRQRKMSLLEAYYENRAYDSLPAAWNEPPMGGQKVEFALRRPSTIVPLPALIVDTLLRALWSHGRRPVASIAGAEGTDDNVQLSELVHEANLNNATRDAVKKALITGTGAVAWRDIDGKLSGEAWDPKYCQPNFVPGQFPKLANVEYVYPYEVEKQDARGAWSVFTMWHRETVDATSWTVFEDVEARSDQNPVWGTSTTVQHGLGECPVVWFTVGDLCGIDGTGVYANVLGLFDDLNCTASQQGRALYQNLDPTLTISGVAEVDLQALSRGGQVWPLPPGGVAALIESDGSYVTAAKERLDYLRAQILDACAVVVPDPEKVGGGPQSGTSLELLSEPQRAKIADLRSDVGTAYAEVVRQMVKHRSGKDVRVALHWGAMGSTTPPDAKLAVEAATSAVSAGLLSRAAAAKFIAPHVGVVDVELDHERIEEEQEQLPCMLETATALSVLQVESPTFQQMFKTSLACAVLGEECTPEIEATIQQELARTNTAESLIPPDDMPDESEPADLTEEETNE